jgi:ubiquinone/menaquinone biosynthesis C-methylase UbiE
MRPQRTHLEVLRERLPLSAATLIDVGCGDGSLTRRLVEEGAQVIGVDPSETAVARASARAGRREQYIVGRAQELPLPTRCADAVTFLNSLHHVPVEAQTRALSEAQRVLRSEGLVYVQEPLAEGDYFELVRSIDDEFEVRAAAQRALHDADRVGLRLGEELEYDAPVRYRHFAAFRERMVLTDGRRASQFDACREELEQRFYRSAESGPDGWTFRQPVRVTVLHLMAMTNGGEA